MQMHASESLKDCNYRLLNFKYLQTSNMSIVFSNFKARRTKVWSKVTGFNSGLLAEDSKAVRFQSHLRVMLSLHLGDSAESPCKGSRALLMKVKACPRASSSWLLLAACHGYYHLSTWQSSRQGAAHVCEGLSRLSEWRWGGPH